MKNSQNILTTGKYLTQFQRKLLEKNLQKPLSKHFRQRIFIMLLADEGKTQKEICETLKCSATTVRHWTLIAKNGEAHQWCEHYVGRPKNVNELYLKRLKELVNNNPRNYGYFCKKWTGNTLSKHLEKEFGIEIHERHIHRLLNEMGLSTRSYVKNCQYSGEETKQFRILIQDL
jgi:transposase